MGLKTDLLWRYDPADIERAHTVAEDAVELAQRALSWLEFTDKSKRWISSKERREMTALWFASLKMIDTLGTFDQKLVGASTQEIRKFLEEFLKKENAN